MRTMICFNQGWQFSKPGEAAHAVTLPHTWNAKDGTDGGNDYFRGTCTYTKEFAAPAHAEGEEVWLEFEGVAMSAVVTLNGQELARHAGGYSTFRVNLTPALAAQNTLTVTVDNSANRTVYPQKADFTFYGGIYRDVYMLVVPHSHFALDNHGAPALRVTPKVADDFVSAEVTIEAFCENTPDGTEVLFTVEGVGEQSAPVQGGKAVAMFTLNPVHLWDGVADPYLYNAAAALPGGDAVAVQFGCRKIEFRPDTGFWLNGKNVRLVGTARHQDRAGLGNALTPAEHEEDMQIIRDMGANTVRLAHYQHAQYFYDLCDKYGLVAWAEIPYITEHMPEARANTLSQMEELVTQNYNHPSIICWGLSNEITAGSAVNEDMLENHRALNDLCHQLDAMRPTSMANVFMLETDSPILEIPDINSYNLYFGWYLGELKQNEQFFDSYHKKYPDRVIGFSEYGAECNVKFQSSTPECGDYSEQYQCLYHEHMLKMFETRPYLWATHVWNMFDFGSDGKDEGGKHGFNQKGLVTADRKIKKDAFYLYKAYWSGEPFVHLCGSRYTDRAEDVTEIKVYSNQPAVTIYIDGTEKEKKEGEHVFIFRVTLTGEHFIEAKAGEWQDCIRIRRVEKAKEDYIFKGGAVTNWLKDISVDESCYSINDSLGMLMKNPQAAAIVGQLMSRASKSRGEVAEATKDNPALKLMMAGMPLCEMLKRAGDAVSADQIRNLNGALQKIEKE